MKDLSVLPEGLPIPIDDGACNHLIGFQLPLMQLSSTSGRLINLATEVGVTVVYFYPLIGHPDAPPMIGWNDIPGARGCTPQSCAFRDLNSEFNNMGVQVFGASSQPLDAQQEAVSRLHLPFELLNDSSLAFAAVLALPTFKYNGQVLIKRLTLIVENGVVIKVFYPVFPPNQNASDVINWLKSRFK